MAYTFFRSATVNLQETNVVKKGTDCVFKFIVEDEDGPVNISEYTVRSEFRNVRTLNATPTSSTANCPQPTVSILSGGLGGEILMEIPHAQTQISGLLTTGWYSIELVHTSTSKVCEVFQGQWSIEDETTGA